MPYSVVSLEDRPDLEPQVYQLSQEAWPEFLRHGNTPHWGRLFDTFADCQILICSQSWSIESRTSEHTKTRMSG